ncbi:hypothetical protein FOCC_FOCC013717 [Frankliniella occidentalis]|nr:hypothetical protein FOCC_FOCC013717 [Frankliniella occidentalis]
MSSRSSKLLQLALQKNIPDNNSERVTADDSVAESPCPPIHEESYKTFKTNLESFLISFNSIQLLFNSEYGGKPGGGSDLTTKREDVKKKRTGSSSNKGDLNERQSPKAKRQLFKGSSPATKPSSASVPLNEVPLNSSLNLIQSAYGCSSDDETGETIPDTASAANSGVTIDDEVSSDAVVSPTATSSVAPNFVSPILRDDGGQVSFDGPLTILVHSTPIDAVPEGGTVLYDEPLSPSGETSTIILGSPGQLDVHGESIFISDPLLETPHTEPNNDTASMELQGTDTTEAEADTTVNNKRRSRSRQASLNSPSRKRKCDESLWKRNVTKALKNSGQAYISSAGKEMEAAKMRGPCSCSLDCVHRVTQEQRENIFQTFWKLGRHDRQWDFIRANSKCAITKPAKAGQPSKRKVSRTFLFTINGQPTKVCKQMFMRTLGICDSWIESAYKKINADKGFTVSPDKRGRHSNRLVKMTPAKIESVKQHVNLFPRVPSHYCRKRSKREYLERGLSINKMARLYTDWAAENNLPKVSIANKRQYRDILNSNFNIGFF